MMTADKFDKIVEARAREIVNGKIKIFRDAINKALEGLLKDTGITWYIASQVVGAHELIPSKQAMEILSTLSDYQWRDDTADTWKTIKGSPVRYATKWPRELLQTAQKKVSDELLQTLDSVARAILAADRPTKEATEVIGGSDEQQDS